MKQFDNEIVLGNNGLEIIIKATIEDWENYLKKGNKEYIMGLRESVKGGVSKAKTYKRNLRYFEERN